MILRAKKLFEDAKLPSYAHLGDAGLDFYAREDSLFKPGERKPVSTGIALEIPKGCVGLIWDKGGVALNGGLKSIGGVFDSGYRGEILISMVNISKKSYIFKKGHKIAQMIIQKCEYVKVKEVSKLSETKRGAGRLGSTGK